MHHSNIMDYQNFSTRPLLSSSIQTLTTNRGEEDEIDLALLKNVADGDKKAFEQLYERLFIALSRYLTRLTRRPELVEELVNDTMYVVWDKADQFQGRSKVTTWVIGIAYLKGIKALDKITRMPEQKADSLSESADVEEETNAISDLGEREWLDAALEMISADQRSVVELTYYFGYSYQEIAEMMNCPVNTVKTRMFHARRRLAKLLPALKEHSKERLLDSEQKQPNDDVVLLDGNDIETEKLELP